MRLMQRKHTYTFASHGSDAMTLHTDKEAISRHGGSFMETKIKRALVIPDTHLPFEDQISYNLMLMVAKESGQIDEVVILGDYVDFYDVSSHPKTPGIECKLVTEIERCHERLMELNALFPKAKKVYICGNHEHRLDRYIQNNASALFGHITIKDILKLDTLGWHFVPYGPEQKYQILGSKLYARHEPVGGGEHCAASTVKKCVRSMIFGHTHRVQEFQIRDIDGELYRGISGGCLIDLNHKVFSYIKSHYQWTQAFTFVDVLPNGDFFHQLVQIVNHKCTYNGKLYEG